MLNKLLLEEVRKHFGAAHRISPELKPFLRSVSKTYDLFERERKVLEQCLRLNAGELRTLNYKLKKEARQLKATNRELNLLFENIEEVFFSIDIPASRVLQMSPGCARVCGYSAEEFYADPALWLNVIVPEDRQAVLNGYAEMRDGVAIKKECRITHKNGSIRWVACKIVPSLDPSGFLLRIDGLVSDITEQRSYQERIVSSEAHLRASQKIAKVGSWELELSADGQPGRLKWWEETFRMFGYAPEAAEVTNELFFSHVPAADRKAIERAMAEAISTGEIYDLEHRVLTKDGRRLFVHERGEVIFDQQTGEPVKIIGTIQDITARKKAEVELLTKEAHLRVSQRIARLGSWEVEISDMEEYRNNSFKLSDECFRLYGYEPGEVPADLELFFSMVHADDRDRVFASVEQAAKSGESFDIEHRIVRKDGVEVQVRGRGEIYRSSSGEPIKIIGTTQDITQQKKSEYVLKQAEANLRNILENTDTCYILLDTAANIIVFNRLAEVIAREVLGNELAVGANYLDLMPADRKSRLKNSIKMVLKGKEKLVYETSYVTDSTGEHWLHVSMYPIFNDKRKVLGLSIAATDITEQKTAEAKIRLSNERYELVTKATRDVIWDWDLRGDSVYLSDNFEQVFGKRMQQNGSSRTTWIEQVYEPDQEALANDILEHLKKPETDLWEAEYRYYRKNGELAYVHDRALIIRNANEAVRMVGAMRDVTSEKLLELEKAKAARDLVQHNNALEQFTYIVSHNLRAPVANILGLASLLQQKDLDEQSFELCRSGIHVSTIKLDEMIRDLDQILRVRHEVNSAREIVCCSTLLDNILLSIKRLVQNEDVEIRADFSEVGEIYCLKSFLYSIFYNLVVNAIKYRTPGVKLQLKIATEKKGNRVLVYFKDNGLGIDLARNADKIFGLYKRFHPGVDGKGMGLFMVKAQAEAMGGRISVESEANKGTTFTLELPA